MLIKKNKKPTVPGGKEIRDSNTTGDGYGV